MKTAEEFLTEKYNLKTIKDRTYLDGVTESMIEFAQYHVTEALKQASEKAKNSYVDEILNDSILNSYPLSNIK